jgi:organic hydroperoxide reductase OsmC/OhrA
MGDYTATVVWRREGAKFTDNRYSRGHSWLFDGGVEVKASASPHVVRLPMSVEAAVDPEEAFVASLSSCHMLFFLSVAARRGFVVDEYRDTATGVMAKNAAGKIAMTVVTLRPAVAFAGAPQPSRAEIESMHDDAHEQCFIASSVRTEVRCEPAEPAVR